MSMRALVAAAAGFLTVGVAVVLHKKRRALKGKPKAAVAAHPLDPLSPAELIHVAGVLAKEGKGMPQYKVVSITLHDPLKEEILAYPSRKIAREAWVVVFDHPKNELYEGVVNLTTGAITEWRHQPDTQPAIILWEFNKVDDFMRSQPEFQAAVAKRGITDFSLVMTDAWSAGFYGDEEKPHRRIVRVWSWARSEPGDNGYARPLEGLICLVDLANWKILRIDDHGIVPLPKHINNFASRYRTAVRNDIKPLAITQKDGPSFTVSGSEVSWQKWKFRVGFTMREGLVLYTISYSDKGVNRPVVYRASIVDLVVPYTDNHITHLRKCAFDAGEFGLGGMAVSLSLGCDCLGEIYYFDAHLPGIEGKSETIKNAVCLHEEDYGVLWKHYDRRLDEMETRRSRRLVISSWLNVGNYDYGMFWYFYQDGTIQCEVKLTGIMSVGLMQAGDNYKRGTLVDGPVYAPIHQHFFAARLDMMVDGVNNSVVEVQTVIEPHGKENPYGNAAYAETTVLRTEQEAQRTIDPLNNRYWKIINPGKHNKHGHTVGYKLVHGENSLPLLAHGAHARRRAGFMDKHVWVTPFDRYERYASGDYPNQSPFEIGLPAYTKKNRSIENTDIVLWYVMGHTHVPRAEDWPVMPVSYIGFSLKPVGFFDENPAMDVPSPPADDRCCSRECPK